MKTIKTKFDTVYEVRDDAGVLQGYVFSEGGDWGYSRSWLGCVSRSEAIYCLLHPELDTPREPEEHPAGNAPTLGSPR